MVTAWNLLILACAVINAVCVGVAWYNGEPAWWFVWLTSIWFSVEVALIALRDLMVQQ
jgi:hypothetical protein